MKLLTPGQRIEAVEQAWQTIVRAEASATAMASRCFPVGCEVGYEHGRHSIFVEVVSTGWRLRVRNPRTGREYWLRATRVTSC